jgi:glucose/mannose-6-phosphate isomerase
VTSDGEMKRKSEEKGLPILSLPVGMQPRAALPNQFFLLATLFNRLGLTAGSWVEVEEAINVLKVLRGNLSPETPSSENPAKQMALALKGFVPFIYGPRLFEAVAYRIGTQLNENSKIPAGSGVFPEVFHNVIMSREGPWEVRSRICAVLIRDPEGSLEIEQKVDAFKGLLETKVGRVLEIWAQGQGKLARMLSALYMGDYTATYLGFLHGINPSSSDSIAALKAA